MIGITGGSGFVGTSLCSILATRNEPFQVIARAAYGQPSAFAGCQSVIHLAGIAHREAVSLEDYLRINRDLALKTIEAAAHAGASRFVYVSSSKALRDFSDSDTPLDEKTTPRPGCSYGKSKLAAERDLLGFSTSEKINVTVVRPALIIGAPPKANLAKLAKLANRRPAFAWRTLFSIFSGPKSFTSLGNLCNALIVCAKQAQPEDNLFHVVDDLPMSTFELFVSLQSAGRLGVRGLSSRSFVSRKVSALPKADALQRNLNLSKFSGMDVLAKAVFTVIGQNRLYDSLAQPLVLDGRKIQRQLLWTPDARIDADLQHIMDTIQ